MPVILKENLHLPVGDQDSYSFLNICWNTFNLDRIGALFRKRTNRSIWAVFLHLPHSSIHFTSCRYVNCKFSFGLPVTTQLSITLLLLGSLESVATMHCILRQSVFELDFDATNQVIILDLARRLHNKGRVQIIFNTKIE